MQYPISWGCRKVRDSHFSAQLPSTSTRAHLPRRLAPRLTLSLAVPRNKWSRKLGRWSGQRRRFAAPMRLFRRLPKARTRTRLIFLALGRAGNCESSKETSKKSRVRQKKKKPRTFRHHCQGKCEFLPRKFELHSNSHFPAPQKSGTATSLTWSR